jgi:hypothetical protein
MQAVLGVRLSDRGSPPYAGRFDGFHALPASISKTCLVRFDNKQALGERRCHGRAGV